MATVHAHLGVVQYLVTAQQVEPLCQDGLHYTLVEKYKPMKDLMPSLTTKMNNTPVHIATQYGHIDILRFFTADLKCSPNIPGQSGRHPFHYAAVRGHLHIMKYFIDEQGCDPSCLDSRKQTPLHNAA